MCNEYKYYLINFRIMYLNEALLDTLSKYRKVLHVTWYWDVPYGIYGE